MNILLALTKIPWKPIVKASPLILETARSLLDSVKKRDVITSDLQKRIELLESSSEQQSILISEMAEHIKNLSESLQVLSARVTILLWILISSLVIASILIIKALFT